MIRKAKSISNVNMSNSVPSRELFFPFGTANLQTFFTISGENIYKKLSLSSDNESVEIDRER